ncbi:MAG: F0F1 ATP synthase subunit epsilon [Candidatus Ancillula sp.]|jgi:F-type H+-transporting ATPase subunit epsilon|nr:F0F1 ATP synthase subunit epsilon [Candidatus Ancillula sp.]
MLSVDFVTTDRQVYTGEAIMVIAPSVDGQIGIMNDHEPVLSILKQGTVKIKFDEAKSDEYIVTGGFLSVNNNEVKIVADSVESDNVETKSVETKN